MKSHLPDNYLSSNNNKQNTKKLNKNIYKNMPNNNIYKNMPNNNICNNKLNNNICNNKPNNGNDYNIYPQRYNTSNTSSTKSTQKTSVNRITSTNLTRR